PLLDERGEPTAAHAAFMAAILDMVGTRAAELGRRDLPVLNYTPPAVLATALDLQLPRRGQTPQRVLELARLVLERSVRTGHPHFFNQLFARVDSVALAGELLTAV